MPLKCGRACRWTHSCRSESRSTSRGCGYRPWMQTAPAHSHSDIGHVQSAKFAVAERHITYRHHHAKL